MLAWIKGHGCHWGRIAAWAAVVMVGSLPPGSAQVRVQKPSDAAAPIDLSGLSGGNDAVAMAFRQTLLADLERYGWFTPTSAAGAAYRVIGEQTVTATELRVRLELVRPASRDSVLRRTYAEPPAQARRLAHRIHDDLVMAATGQRGIAATTLLLIGSRTGHKEMYWVDADGANLRQVTRDQSICVAPAWAPDGRRFVVTSFLGGFPDVYLVDLVSGRRDRIAAYPGLNSSAAFSPDGRELALILSKDGNPDLYVRDLRSGRLTRLTQTRHANEASPSWSPDGRRLVYVSDSTGIPHLYLIDRRSERVQRLTRRGRDNASPDWGPGNRIVFSSRRGVHHQLFLIDPDSGEETQLTDAPVNHEEPSWAPDGRHVAYTRGAVGQSGIYMLDIVTGSSVPLMRAQGEWYSPVWSPQ